MKKKYSKPSVRKSGLTLQAITAETPVSGLNP